MSDTQPFNLLFVCTGNSCRSPMAEVITRAALTRRAWSHVEVASAGVAAGGGAASSGAQTVVAEHGLDLQSHGSRMLTPDLVEWADLVLVMAPHHLLRVAELGGADRAAVITDFAADGSEATPSGQGVSDPYGGDDDEYRETFEELRDLVDRLLGRLEPILAP